MCYCSLPVPHAVFKGGVDLGAVSGEHETAPVFISLPEMTESQCIVNYKNTSAVFFARRVYHSLEPGILATAVFLSPLLKLTLRRV